MMDRFWNNPFVRQALQATAGVAAAIAIGALISGHRWYWAVIAAFIVGTGVGSRGEAMIKALQRLAGTLAGIVMGMLLASAVSSHTDLALGLALACVFFAFYAFQAAYGIMMFCITLMLALLYGLVGQFEPHLLVLRLEETAAGAAVGVLAAVMLLPVRQGEVFRRAAREFLLALKETLSKACGADAATSARAMGELQGKAQALRHSLGAVKRGWIPLVPLHYRYSVRSAMRCAYLVREMVYRGGIDRPQIETVLLKIDELLARLALDAPLLRSPESESRESDQAA